MVGLIFKTLSCNSAVFLCLGYRAPAAHQSLFCYFSEISGVNLRFSLKNGMAYDIPFHSFIFYCSYVCFTYCRIVIPLLLTLLYKFL
uniref:Uncharacterized protein n=1 Tax=Rhizophora mucronata TaxID=61149 RepID=A0A2P2PPB1_RHIMU